MTPPASAVPQSQVLAHPTKDHLSLYSAFRDYLKHEDDLINNRLNWNFTVQGFLFASYSFSLQKIADIRLGLLSRGIDTQRIAELKVLHTIYDLHLLLAALAFVGMAVSGFVYLSVKAARLAIKEVESRWFEVEPSCKPSADFSGLSWLKHFLSGQDTAPRTHGKFSLPGMVGGGNSAAHWLGFYAPGGLPLIIIGVWFFLFVDALLDLWW